MSLHLKNPNKAVVAVYKKRLLWAGYYNGQLVYQAYQTVKFDPKKELQEYKVPAGANHLMVRCVASAGAKSDSAGGKGGMISCWLKVTPGQVLYIQVGDVPTSPTEPSYNAADVRTGKELKDRVVVAGGGGSGSSGGWGGVNNGRGGNGGGLVGEAGEQFNYTAGGQGGTQTAGGRGGFITGGKPAVFYGGQSGTAELGGAPGSSGGAGGAGWFGGGGGAWYRPHNSIQSVSGGGGGSSYSHPDLCSKVIHTQGHRDGAGYVIIKATAF